MNDVSEEKVLWAIKHAVSIETDLCEVEDCFTEKYPQLSDDPTDEERCAAADSGTVIFEDTGCIPRIPIKINTDEESITVYHDIRDGGVYDDTEDGELYSDAVQEALVDKGKTFDGNGIDNGDEINVVKFVLGEASSDNTFIKRSEISEE